MDQAITRAAGAAPRAVGEFQGYVDGANGLEPSVRWLDRKNMPQVGDRLFAIPARVAVPRSWAILLTSANHGTVGPLGSTFPHAGEKHERVVVVEVPAGAGVPSDQVNLVLRAPLAEARIYDIAASSELGIGTDDDEMAKRTAFARAIEREVAAQAGQVAPADVPNGGMHDSIFVKVWGDAGGGDAGRRALANYAYKLGKRDAAGQVAVPEDRERLANVVLHTGYLLSSQEYLHAANLGNGGPGFAESVAKADARFRAAVERLVAAPAAPAQAKPLPADWSAIGPMPFERDENGWWSHPAIPNFDEDHAAYKGWLRAVGLEFKYKTLESYPEHPLYDAWFERGECNASSWEPEDPSGEGWFTFSIHDTEDGPVWVWARRIGAQASTAGGRQEGGDLEQVVGFLMGESELEGVKFGDRHPTKAGAFWWRLNLRAAMHKLAGARG